MIGVEIQLRSALNLGGVDLPPAIPVEWLPQKGSDGAKSGDDPPVCIQRFAVGRSVEVDDPATEFCGDHRNAERRGETVQAVYEPVCVIRNLDKLRVILLSDVLRERRPAMRNTDEDRRAGRRGQDKVIGFQESDEIEV